MSQKLKGGDVYDDSHSDWEVAGSAHANKLLNIFKYSCDRDLQVAFDRQKLVRKGYGMETVFIDQQCLMLM